MSKNPFARVAGVHDKLAGSHASLLRGRVWCTSCANTRQVDVTQCLKLGWPKCCGVTMTIDSPEERKEMRK